MKWYFQFQCQSWQDADASSGSVIEAFEGSTYDEAIASLRNKYSHPGYHGFYIDPILVTDEEHEALLKNAGPPMG